MNAIYQRAQVDDGRGDDRPPVNEVCSQAYVTCDGLPLAPQVRSRVTAGLLRVWCGEDMGMRRDAGRVARSKVAMITLAPVRRSMCPPPRLSPLIISGVSHTPTPLVLYSYQILRPRSSRLRHPGDIERASAATSATSVGRTCSTCRCLVYLPIPASLAPIPASLAPIAPL